MSSVTDKIRAEAILALQSQFQDHPWVHVNGYVYDVLLLAIDDDLDEINVIHKGRHDGRVWSRTLDNFAGFHGSGVKRFQPAPVLDADLLRKAASYGRSLIKPGDTLHSLWDRIFDLEARADGRSTQLTLTDKEWNELAEQTFDIVKGPKHG